MAEAELRARQNIARTRIAVLVAFALNAGLNVVLLGWFARQGGMDLVGTWSFLGAVLMNVLILDLGLTNALIFRIGRDGVESILPALARLLRLGLAVAGLVLVLAAGAAVVGGAGMALALAGAAACLQLSSDWLITPRMGQGQIYWFNLKTILRVIVQSAAAVFLFQAWPGHPDVAFGLALMAGAVAEVLFAVSLARGILRRLPAPLPLAEIGPLLRGFGLENVSQRAFPPLSQLLVGQMLGHAALGTFTIALRIPVVVSQSVSEALRGLLPGLATLLPRGETEAAKRLLRDGLATQIVLLLPAAIFLLTTDREIFLVWIGSAPAELRQALHLLVLSMVFSSVFTPFYWGNQAAGGVSLAARSSLLRLAIAVLGGGTVILSGGGLIDFVAVFALSQLIDTLICLLIAHFRFDLLRGPICDIRWRAVAGLVAVSLAVNLWLMAIWPDTAPLTSLLISVFANAAIVAPLSLWGLRAKWYVRGAAG